MKPTYRFVSILVNDGDGTNSEYSKVVDSRSSNACRETVNNQLSKEVTVRKRWIFEDVGLIKVSFEFRGANKN